MTEILHCLERGYMLPVDLLYQSERHIHDEERPYSLSTHSLPIAAYAESFTFASDLMQLSPFSHDLPFHLLSSGQKLVRNRKAAEAEITKKLLY